MYLIIEQHDGPESLINKSDYVVVRYDGPNLMSLHSLFKTVNAGFPVDDTDGAGSRAAPSGLSTQQDAILNAMRQLPDNVTIKQVIEKAGLEKSRAAVSSCMSIMRKNGLLAGEGRSWSLPKGQHKSSLATANPSWFATALRTTQILHLLNARSMTSGDIARALNTTTKNMNRSLWHMKSRDRWVAQSGRVGSEFVITSAGRQEYTRRASGLGV